MRCLSRDRCVKINTKKRIKVEFIEVEAAPEAIAAATRADFDKEIKHLQSMGEIGLKQMLNRINEEMLEPE